MRTSPYLLHQAIERAAARFPDREAVRHEDGFLTYSELNAYSNAFAQFLVARGMQQGDRVGIFRFKGLESLVALWGIMKAGGVYIPIDPRSPVTRLAGIINQCAVRFLVTESELLSSVYKAHAVENSTLEYLVGVRRDGELATDLKAVEWQTIYNEYSQEKPPDTNLIEQDLAYIIFTSGSTGEPKGIMHTHHSGLAYANWTVEEFHLSEFDRIANHSPFHFDISLFDIFGGALAGACVVLIPEEYTLLPASFSQLLQDERITLIFTVPFALIQLSERGVLEQRDLSALKWILYGGEPYPPKHLRSLMEQLPDARFCNIYGPAEVNGVSYYHIREKPEDDDQPIPIGVMCTFAQSIIVDEQTHIVEEGETGEILIRSASMMQGYWGRPDLNQKAFFYREPYPNAQFFEKYYRTGDLARLLPDGNLHFLGRKDRQIKTRGYRVELDEIESNLVSHPRLEEAAVFTVQSLDGTRLIYAAVRPIPGETIVVDELFAFLRDRIPSYALPQEIDIRQDFPRTTSGKIDRRALARQAENGESEK